MTVCSKTLKLNPEGKCALLDQALKLIVKQNGNALKFVQLMRISKSFTGCVKRFSIYSLGLKCFGNYDYKLFISGTKAFEENCEQVAYFDELSRDKMRDLILYLNPTKFIANFFDEFWWNKSSESLEFVNAPIDMVCNVSSDFLLCYQMTPFWQFNLRRLKLNCSGKVDESFYRSLRAITIDSALPAFKYEGAEKSATLQHLELNGLFFTHLKYFVDSLKFRCPKLISLKVKSSHAPIMDYWLYDLLRMIQCNVNSLQTIKKTCANWIANFDLDADLTYILSSREDGSDYVEELKKIERLSDADWETNVGSDETKYTIKLKEQDEVINLSFKIATHHGIHLANDFID